MADLGKKYTCYSCHTKFYDLGKPDPLCPKCGSDQRDADDKPVVTSSRKGRAAAVAPLPVIEEPEFESEAEPAAVVAEGEEDEEIISPADDREEADDEEEEEY